MAVLVLSTPTRGVQRHRTGDEVEDRYCQNGDRDRLKYIEGSRHRQTASSSTSRVLVLPSAIGVSTPRLRGLDQAREISFPLEMVAVDTSRSITPSFGPMRSVDRGTVHQNRDQTSEGVRAISKIR